METTQTIGRPRTIHRVRHGRMLGGVAGGVADYFDIDPVIVRIVFVALAIAGGSGVALYLLAWVLIPEEGCTRPILGTGWRIPGGRATRVGLTITLGLVLFFTVAAGAATSWPVWRVHTGPTVSTLAALSVLAVVLAFRARRAPFVLVRLMLVLVALGLIASTVALTSVTTLARATGVPLRGGIGDRTWQPTSASELQRAYRLTVGEMTVDLSHVPFDEGDHHVTASVGVGRLIVLVPDGVDAQVNARSGAGQTNVFGSREGGVGARRLSPAPAAGRHLSIDARAGIGEVDVIHSSDTRPERGFGRR